MTYAKLISNYPSFAPNPILHDGNYIGNPLGSVYEAEGYKPVRTTEPEGEAPAGYQWVETWTETDSEIVRGWEAVELPPEGDIDPAEALDIILGGESA